MAGPITEKPHGEGPAVEPTREAPTYTPRFDIFETDSELTLYGDLPGVTQDQLDVLYENQELIIHGKVPPRDAAKTSIRKEYRVGDFHRTFSIGEVVDVSAITAEIHQGALTICLPKTQEAKPRRIEVNSV